MYFIILIIEYLAEARDWFRDAYLEVRDWIFPFYYLQYPLYGLYAAFHYLVYYFGEFDRWLVWANTMLGDLPTVWTFWVYFEEWLMAGWSAWEWVTDAIANVWNTINNWWAATSTDVLGWIDEVKNWALTWINFLWDQLNELRVMIQDLPGAIPDLSVILAWFTDWTGNVSSVIDTWWAGALLEVRTLINSAFIERESWWAGWSDLRDQVATFFSDPLSWLEEKFTDWFLGAE